MKWALTFFFISIVALPHTAHACAPCETSEFLSLEQVVEEANLIIIGKRYNPPWFFNDNNSENGPSLIEIEVLRVLKGQLTRKDNRGGRFIDVPFMSVEAFIEQYLEAEISE